MRWTTTTCARWPRPRRRLKLVVAGSGLAIGIPALHGLAPSAQAAQLPPAGGARAVVSGSCSAATNAQVAAFIATGGAAFAVDPLQLAAGADLAAEALAWARPRLGAAPVLVYATAEPAAVRAVQAAARRRARRRAGGSTRCRASRVGLVDAGVGQLIVAGGETSGACVQAPGHHAAAHRRRRSTPACPGATRPARAAGCTWR